MRLVYSLVHLNNNQMNYHLDYTYDMFYVSMTMAKDLGYSVVLFGSSDVLSKLKGAYDVSYDVTNMNFFLYDDIKIHILNTLPGNDYCIIDGDLFLFERLNFGDEFDEELSSRKLMFSYEDFDVKPKEKIVIDALQYFNSFNPKAIIPEWNNLNLSSCNTGLLKLHSGSNDFKSYYIESYMKLRGWYLERLHLMNKHELLKTNRTIASHFICEHLLYQLAKHYKLGYLSMYKKRNNDYSHWKGPTKFNEVRMTNGIYQLSKAIKNKNGLSNLTAKQIYINLVNSGMFPFYSLDT